MEVRGVRGLWNCVAVEQSGYIREWQNLLLTLSSYFAHCFFELLTFILNFFIELFLFLCYIKQNHLNFEFYFELLSEGVMNQTFTFADRLKSAMEQKHMNQDDLIHAAETAGVKVGISHISQ